MLLPRAIHKTFESGNVVTNKFKDGRGENTPNMCHSKTSMAVLSVKKRISGERE